MRAMRISLVATVTLALVGGLYVGVVAQDEEEATPTATYVTGTIIQSLGSGDSQSWEEGGVVHGRGMMTETVVEWSDPRLPSRLFRSMNLDEHTPSGMVTASSVRLEEGPDGAWVGTGRGYYGFALPEGCHDLHDCELGPGDGPKIAGLMTLTGEGAYGGLSAVIADAWMEGTPALEGFIFEGEPPPFPEPIEPGFALE